METSAKTAMNVNDIFMAIGKFHWLFTSAKTFIYRNIQQNVNIISMIKKNVHHFAVTFLQASVLLSFSVKDLVSLYFRAA